MSKQSRSAQTETCFAAALLPLPLLLLLLLQYRLAFVYLCVFTCLCLSVCVCLFANGLRPLNRNDLHNNFNWDSLIHSLAYAHFLYIYNSYNIVQIFSFSCCFLLRIFIFNSIYCSFCVGESKIFLLTWLLLSGRSLFLWLLCVYISFPMHYCSPLPAPHSPCTSSYTLFNWISWFSFILWPFAFISATTALPF